MNTLLITIGILVILVVAAGMFLFKPKNIPKTQSVYTDALSAIIRQEPERAADLLRTVVRTDSSHVEAYMHLGDLLRDLNQAQKALKIHQSLTVRPDLPKQHLLAIHQSLVLDYERLMDYRRAGREAEQMLKLDRRNIWALEFLLKIAELNSDWEQAMQLVKNIQRQRKMVDTKALAEIKLKEGLDYLKDERRKDAINSLNRAVKIAPDYGEPLFELGQLYYSQGDLDQAVTYWERFALCCPDQGGKVYTDVESALFELGRYGEAESFYRRLLKKTPTLLDAMVRLANVLVDKGEQRAAVNLVEETLSKSSDSIPAHLMQLKLELGTRNQHDLLKQVDRIMELIVKSNCE